MKYIIIRSVCKYIQGYANYCDSTQNRGKAKTVQPSFLPLNNYATTIDGPAVAAFTRNLSCSRCSRKRKATVIAVILYSTDKKRVELVGFWRGNKMQKLISRISWGRGEQWCYRCSTH